MRLPGRSLFTSFNSLAFAPQFLTKLRKLNFRIFMIIAELAISVKFEPGTPHYNLWKNDL